MFVCQCEDDRISARFMAMYKACSANIKSKLDFTLRNDEEKEGAEGERKGERFSYTRDMRCLR